MNAGDKTDYLKSTKKGSENGQVKGEIGRYRRTRHCHGEWPCRGIKPCPGEPERRPSPVGTAPRPLLGGGRERDKKRWGPPGRGETVKEEKEKKEGIVEERGEGRKEEERRGKQRRVRRGVVFPRGKNRSYGLQWDR
jgi:hypothetical protein